MRRASPADAPRGRLRRHELREIVDGWLHMLRVGISWRAMPHELPPWESVNDDFRRWGKNSTLERIHAVLR
jgi:putative transposase